MKENQEILLVDDDRVTRAAYSSVFRSEGYQVRLAKNGVEGVAAFLEKRPDIVILDVMMPQMNGLEACRLMRERDTKIPIFILSGGSDDTKKLRAYALGSDDFIEKKTNPDILLAKIRAALRRKQLAERMAASTGRVCLGSVVVDLADRSVFVSNKLSCRLTRTENDILRVLSAHRGQPLVRQELVAELRGKGYACTASMIYNHIWNLRTKLRPSANWLTNMRGIGYSLRNEVPPEQ